MTANASGLWGLLKGGASWFQFQWCSDWNNVNIATTELFPLVVTTAILGIKWKRGSVLFRSDNQAVVAALSAYSASDFTVAHVPWIDNGLYHGT